MIELLSGNACHAADAARLLTAAAKTVLLLLAEQDRHGLERSQAERM